MWPIIHKSPFQIQLLKKPLLSPSGLLTKKISFLSVVLPLCKRDLCTICTSLNDLEEEKEKDFFVELIHHLKVKR